MHPEKAHKAMQASTKHEVVVLEKPCDRTSGGVSNIDKWIIATILAVIFAILASGPAFSATNMVFSRFGYPTKKGNGGPTILGLVVNAIIFLIIVRLLMH
jgi:hypothetical protein